MQGVAVPPWIHRLGFLPVAIISVALPAAISAGLIWHGVRTESGSSIALGAIGAVAWVGGLVLALRPRKKPDKDNE